MTDDDPRAAAAFSAVIAAATAPAHRRSTLLHAWLATNHDELVKPLSGKPNWRAIALALTDAGVTGRGGAELSGEAVRKAWRRICRT